jgi:hypothetical protein
LGDKLDALYDTLNDNVLNARVFSLGVFTNEDCVNVVVGGLISRNGAAWTDIGEEVEGTAEREI